MPGAITQGIIWGIMAIGVYVTFKILDVADLTVDGSFATGGAVLVVMVTSGQNIYFAMFCSFLAGCLAGLATGLLHTKFGIPAILAGILTQLSLYSINLRIQGDMANLPLSYLNYKYPITLRNVSKTLLPVKVSKSNELLSMLTRLCNQSLLICALMAGVLIAALYWFFGTERGHALRVTGSNLNMARANGINTDTNKIIGIVLSNGIVAFSGGILAQYQGFCDVNMGRGAIVIGLAAVIIGEVIFGKIFHNFSLKLLATIIGGIVYYVVITLVLNLGMKANDLKLFTAIVVAVFLGIPFWKAQLTQKFGGRKTAEENKEVAENA